MIATPDRLFMTPEEYLTWEEQQEFKHEYIDGEVVAMTGGTVNHGVIAANLFYQLKGHLQSRPCRPFIFDIKLGISEKGPFHYPDVMVTCDERDKKAKKVIYHPCLIIEVLSPGTEGFDRGFWELHTYIEGDQFELKSVDFNCSLDVIYEEVILEAEETSINE